MRPWSRWFATWPSWAILLALWTLTVAIDRLWFALDHAPPPWDQAEYLTAALTYWKTLRSLDLGAGDLFSGGWWLEFWQLTSKIPPLTAIATVPGLMLFGASADAATWVNSFANGGLLLAVYGLGRRLFDRPTGLWAAAIVGWLPGLVRVRLDYLIDFPLTAAVAVAFFCLTEWRWRVGGTGRMPIPQVSSQSVPQRWGAGQKIQAGLQRFGGMIARYCSARLVPTPWFWAIAFGVAFGLALLVKQPALFFLLIPGLVMAIGCLRQGRWAGLGQLVMAGAIALAVCLPWYRANWLQVLTGSKRATLDSAAAEGDPSVLSLAAWTYYPQRLPELLGWPLLALGVLGAIAAGWLLWDRRRRSRAIASDSLPPQPETEPSAGFAKTRPGLGWPWLGWFLLGAYLFGSLLVNKDGRYLLPALPMGAIALARAGLAWPGRGGAIARWSALGMTVFLSFSTWYGPGSGGLLPGGGASLAEQYRHAPYRAQPWPHEAVMAEILAAAPGVQQTIGVLPSTIELNQHNVNFYGAIATLNATRDRQFQLYARQIGTDPTGITGDARSLDWYLLKDGNQGSMRPRRRREAQAATRAAIATSPDLQVQRQWPLPDGSTLSLYRRQPPSVALASPLAEAPTASPRALAAEFQLQASVPPAPLPPGQPFPLTYTWSGPQGVDWRSLTVALTWQRRDPAGPPTGRSEWIDDRAIGQGRVLSPASAGNRGATGRLSVIERTATLPPADLLPGTYDLSARLVDPARPGQAAPLAAIGSVTLSPSAAPVAAPELDRVTQLRLLGLELRQGLPVFDRVFAQIGRLGQYEPTQAYAHHAAVALRDRLQTGQPRPGWAYGWGLAAVLQQDVPGAIAAFEQATRLDPTNAYAHAYLAFVNLYDFRAGAALAAIERAIALDPQVKEFYGLRSAARLLTGNWLGARADLGRFL